MVVFKGNLFLLFFLVNEENHLLHFLRKKSLKKPSFFFFITACGELIPTGRINVLVGSNVTFKFTPKENLSQWKFLKYANGEYVDIDTNNNGKYVLMNYSTHYNLTIRHIESGDQDAYVMRCQTICYPRFDIYVYNIQLHPVFDPNKTIQELGCKECLIGWRGELTPVTCAVDTKDLHQRFIPVSTVFFTERDHIRTFIGTVAVYLTYEPYIKISA